MCKNIYYIVKFIIGFKEFGFVRTVMTLGRVPRVFFFCPKGKHILLMTLPSYIVKRENIRTSSEE